MKGSVALLSGFLLLVAVSASGCKVTQQSSTAPDGSGTASEINVDFNDQVKQDVNDAMNTTRQEFDASMAKIDDELKRLGDKARNTELDLKIKQYNEEKSLLNVRFEQMKKDDGDDDHAATSRVQEEWADMRQDMKELWQAIKDDADRKGDEHQG